MAPFGATGVPTGRILHHGQAVFVPDFVFRHTDGMQVLMEIVGMQSEELAIRTVFSRVWISS